MPISFEDYPSFGYWLRRRRKALDLTQAELGRHAGCSAATIRKIEADERKPSLQLAELLAGSLQIPEDQLESFVQLARGVTPSGASTILEEEFGLEPQAVKTKLYEDIKAGRFGRQRAEDLLKPPLRINNNLPAETTPLIGRDEDLEQIRGFFTVDGRRLVTIAGPGGMGKTRLALAYLDRHLTADSPFPDGIFFIDLAPLTGPDQIPSALADALNFSLQGSDARSPQQQIIDYVRHKKMLLLFDNFEHLLDGVEMVVDLLESARDLKVLVTSRERLNVRLEQLYPIEGLQFPDWGTPDDVETYTAVQMFLQSARRNQPDFALRDGDDLTYLVHICRLVAGMPLALEMAASWVDMLPLAEIAVEMQHALDFLETDMRDLPERQRSVRAAIDYSWQHLTEKEQEVFAKLSVFRGGFTREAARAVAEANLRQMGRLVDKSFLQYDQIHDRYLVHELMRQYGAEKLADAESVQTQHLNFFVAFAENVEAGLGGPEPDSWANRLRVDMDNCRAALDWAAESDQAQAGLQMAAALQNYWTAFSDWREARQRLAQLLALPAAAQRTLARAYTLHEAGNLACHMGDYEAGFALLEESREIGLELGEAGKVCVGFTLVAIAEHLLPQGNKAAARKALDEGIAILREAGEPWQLWLGFTIRGVMAIESGDYPQAATFFNEALAFARKIGHRWLSGISMSTLGYLLYLQGDFGTARTYLEESEIILRPLNDLKHRSLSSLGAIALLQGNHQQAVTYFEERLTNSRQQGNEVDARAMSDLGIATGHLRDHTRSAALLSEALIITREASNLYDKAVCLLGVAGIQPRPRKAVQLLAAAQAAFEASGAIMVEPLYNAESEHIEKAARAVLGETAFTAAYTAGKTLAAEKAIAMALMDSHEWADGSFSSLDWR